MARYAATTALRGSSGAHRYAVTTRAVGHSSQALYAATTRVRGFALAGAIVGAGTAATVEGGLATLLDAELQFGPAPEVWTWSLKASSNPAVTQASLGLVQLDLNGTWQYTSPGVEVPTFLTWEVRADTAGLASATATRIDTVLPWPGPWVWRSIAGTPQFIAEFPG